MDYEAVDKDMSSWVVSVRKYTTQIFLTEDGLGTDRLLRAKRYRYYDMALSAATAARDEKPWQGFMWEPLSVPEALERLSNA